MNVSTKKGIPSDDNNFVRALREALVKKYGDGADSPMVALGGSFVMKSGKARCHVMVNYKISILGYSVYESISIS